MDESRKYIEEHYRDEISLERIATLYHFNASYFSTLFKQRFGISFSEYLSDIRMEKAEDLLKTSSDKVRDIRMEKAEDLLKTSSDKVREIALEVGYKDPNYFNRAFKKRHNMTPEEFRKRVG
ncbi:AraC family transcriptional regulator [Ruminococcus sp. AF25-23LB]|nr:AraC family transcriptional regulator [Ruminococcus sp. AF25-23LB]